MKIRKICSILLAICMLVPCVFALTDEETKSIEDLLKENAQSVTINDCDIDYTTEDAFDNLVITEHINDFDKIVFSFTCKAHKNLPHYDNLALTEIGDYRIFTYPQGEYLVYSKAENKLVNISDAYNSNIVTDTDLDYLYNNCAYKAEDRITVDKVTDDPLNAVIIAQANEVYEPVWDEGINTGEFADLKVEKFYSDDNIDIFRFSSSTEIVIDGDFDLELGDYYYQYMNGDELYVYNKANDKLMFLETAYNAGLVNDEILDEMAEKYFHNRMDKAEMRYLGEIVEDSDTDTDIITDTNTDTNTDIVETDTEINTDTNVDTETESDTDINTDSEAETDTETDTDIVDDPIIYGDVNHDGEVDIIDVVLIRGYIVGSNFLTEDIYNLTSADVYADGEIDIVDVVIIRKAIVTGEKISILYFY